MNIIKETFEKSRIQEATYSGALTSIIKKLRNRFPEPKYRIERNKDHRCADVYENDVLVAQVYPGAIKTASFKTKRLQKVLRSEVSDLPEDAVLYTSVTGEAFGPSFTSKDEYILVKRIRDTGNGKLLDDIASSAEGELE